jgi:hypothetical protein
MFQLHQTTVTVMPPPSVRLVNDDEGARAHRNQVRACGLYRPRQAAPTNLAILVALDRTFRFTPLASVAHAYIRITCMLPSRVVSICFVCLSHSFGSGSLRTHSKAARRHNFRERYAASSDTTRPLPLVSVVEVRYLESEVLQGASAVHVAPARDGHPVRHLRRVEQVAAFRAGGACKQRNGRAKARGSSGRYK